MKVKNAINHMPAIPRTLGMDGEVPAAAHKLLNFHCKALTQLV